ncbi:MAG: hypothetical protein GKS05_13235 [Nitrospirales bacterium]|nr:hypothetical protein [Nitrospirales bacterium]NKB82818.1 hypothetical protein [Nitrospirales bacterium]
MGGALVAAMNRGPMVPSRAPAWAFRPAGTSVTPGLLADHDPVMPDALVLRGTPIHAPRRLLVRWSLALHPSVRERQINLQHKESYHGIISLLQTCSPVPARPRHRHDLAQRVGPGAVSYLHPHPVVSGWYQRQSAPWPFL